MIDGILLSEPDFMMQDDEMVFGPGIRSFDMLKCRKDIEALGTICGS